MPDLSQIEGFEWDSGNARKGDKHSVAQGDVEQVFFNDPIIIDDVKHGGAEQRFQALGPTNDGKLLHVTFTLRKRQTMVRVISARPMSRKERVRYGQEIEGDSEVPERG